MSFCQKKNKENYDSNMIQGTTHSPIQHEQIFNYLTYKFYRIRLKGNSENRKYREEKGH
jgi:hypothetical protein